MSNKIRLIKTLMGSLIPENEQEQEKLKRIKAGDVIEVEFKKPRNAKFHRKFFALMNITYQNLPEQIAAYFPQMDLMRMDVIVEAGHFDMVFNVKGERYKRAKSISFASMDGVEFEKLYNDCINTILQHYLIGTIEDDLREAVAKEIATRF